MPTILATWEAEIRRLTIPGQPRQQKFAYLISMEKLDLVACICLPSKAWKCKTKLWFRLAWPKSKTLSPK
jgi:hypothetical protein